MANLVTIVGSVTPSSWLPRGQKKTVARTAFIDKMIRKGFVEVVTDHGEQPERFLTPRETEHFADAVKIAGDIPRTDEQVAADTEREADEQAEMSRNAAPARRRPAKTKKAAETVDDG